MSLILDALRKSDHARARNATERLRDGPSIAHASRFPSSAFFLLLAAIALAAAAIVAALTIDRAATHEHVETTKSERAPKTAAVRALGTETISRRIEMPAREAAARETLAPAVTTIAPPAQTLTVDELAAPPFASLPAEMRGRLPSLHVDIHAWAEDPDARFVLINLKRYREGDQLEEGPLVRHILRDGVVLEFEGTLFSLSRR